MQQSIAESDDELDYSDEEKRNSKKSNEEKLPAPHNVEPPVFERTPSEAEVSVSIKEETVRYHYWYMYNRFLFLIEL